MNIGRTTSSIPTLWCSSTGTCWVALPSCLMGQQNNFPKRFLNCTGRDGIHPAPEFRR